MTQTLLFRLNRAEASECGGEFVGLESEGTGAALVCDAAVGVDQINAIGPAGVLPLSRIAELVEHRGKPDPQLAHAEPCKRRAFLLVPGTCEDDLILNIALHLPDVTGVRFSDVNHEEGDLIAVLLIQLVECGNLPAKRWSGIAAEDQHRRLLTVERSELNLSALVNLGERKIGRGISDAKIACARVRPERFKWEGKKDDGAGHPGHHAPEGFGRLAHRGIDRGAGKNPNENERAEDLDQCSSHCPVSDPSLRTGLLVGSRRRCRRNAHPDFMCRDYTEEGQQWVNSMKRVPP